MTARNAVLAVERRRQQPKRPRMLRARGAPSRGACRHCRNGNRWTAGICLRRQSRNGHQNFDQPEPRRGRPHHELTAFTDGCSGLRSILADAGVTTAPFLDWFHIGMRLQHLKQIASGLSCDNPSREAAKGVIVGEVERLHWRLWNGKATNARISIDRIHAAMHHFKGMRVHEGPTHRRESCGPRCTRWMVTCPARVTGWSTTPSGIGPD
jgi:hypothetical protein